MLLLIIGTVFVATFLAKLLTKWYQNCTRKSIKDRHVVVTGGSSGIGKSIAVLAAKEGAHVTIVARNKTKLEKAEEEVKNACLINSQKIQTVSLDVSKYNDVEKCLTEIDENVAPIYMLINCAGVAICGKTEDMAVPDVQKMIDVNYYGTYFPIKAIISKMKQRREGAIVITGSQGSLFGIYGYSAYAGSKFALRGLAESLHMEVKPYDITVTLALPPDTDTPGYRFENKSKPIETYLISKSAGLFRPDRVARKILEDALNGTFFSYTGFESFLLTTLCVGMTPYSTLFDLSNQIILLGPLKLISCFYLRSFNNMIRKSVMKQTEQCKM